MPARQKTKYYCITLNNYLQADVLHFASLIEHPRVSYIVFGKEGANNTPHLQTYIEFNNRTTLDQAKAIVSDRAHFEKRRGTAQEAADYCKKEGDYQEFGEISQDRSGHRTDLEDLKKDLADGKSLKEISDEHFGSYMRYRRSIQSYMQLHETPRQFVTKVHVFWGATGTGKTKAVYEKASYQDIYTHPGGPWFDGYMGQEIALFDDFGGSEFKLTYLLKLLDRYPMKVPIKGNFVEWKPKHIYITSNKKPDDWYPNAYPEHQAALARRIHEIKEF